MRKDLARRQPQRICRWLMIEACVLLVQELEAAERESAALWQEMQQAHDLTVMYQTTRARK
jgi:hypothetical protein